VTAISERAKADAAHKEAPADATGGAPPSPPQSPYRVLQAEREVVRRALRVSNERSDRHFRQLAFNAFIRVASAVVVVLIIIAGGIVSHYAAPHDPNELGTQALLMLVGAMGALTSNMLTRSLLLAATGPNRRFILYNVLMRPVLGAIAAYVFVVLALSGLLFQIQSGIAPTATSPAPATHPALITITLPSQGAVSAAYFVFAFAFGFSAERILARTLDQALQRLFTTAEKTSAGRLEDQTAT
jgi:hypothetical protein